MSDDAGLIPQIAADDLSTQAARSANAQQEKFEEAKRSGRTMLPMPNGDFGFFDEDEEYLQHAYRSGRHMSTLSRAREMLEDPKPDCIYVWAAREDPRRSRPNPQTVSQIRQGNYRPVTADELKPHVSEAVERFSFAGFKDVVGVVDVLLMEVNAKAQRELYKWRTALAKTRTNRWAAFGELRDRVASASGGLARAEGEILH